MSKKEISIEVIYDRKLKNITGKYAERIPISSSATSLEFIDLLLKKYPKIREIPPIRLGFERNNKIPKASQVLQDGDRYELVVHDDDGGYEFKPEEMDKLFKKAEKILGPHASREELTDFVTDKIPRKELDGLSNFDMKVLQAVAEEGDGGFLVPAGTDEEVERMLDCAWKRIPCGSDSCPICGRINRDRRKFISQGKDPDSLESVFESVGAQLAETLAMVKKDTDRMGIDITNLDDVKDAPEPESFPLALKAEKWYKNLMKYVQKENETSAAWLLTEESLDLRWYAGTLNVKIYRQLCNRWYIDNEKDYGEFDYAYTTKVLDEVCEIINRAFQKLAPVAPPLKQFHRTFLELNAERRNI